MKKQIEEMARVIQDTWLPRMEGMNTVGELRIGSRDADRIATNLYSAGYRKQSEVAMEIFEEIDENVLGGHFLKSYEWHEEEYGKLKKKFNIEE